MCQSKSNRLALIALRGVKQSVCIVKPCETKFCFDEKLQLQLFTCASQRSELLVIFVDPNMNCAHLKDLYPKK